MKQRKLSEGGNRGQIALAAGFFSSLVIPLRGAARALAHRSWLVVLLLLAVHGPLLLNNGLYMDDWLLLEVRPDYAVTLDFMVRGAGHPLIYAYFTLANATGVPLAVMKAAALFSIVFGALALQSAAVLSRLATKAEGAILAFAVWAYPGYEIWAGKANSAYVLFFGLFCVGTWCLVAMHRARGRPRLAWRIGALAAFFLSFALNSILALYLSVALGLLIAVWRGREKRDAPFWRRGVWAILHTVRRYGDFLMLPLLYWLWLNVFFPRGGAYDAHYHMHVPDLREFIAGLVTFGRAGYKHVLIEAFWTVRYSRLWQLIVVAALGLSLVSVLFPRRPWTRVMPIAWPATTACALFAVLTLPYVVTGNVPDGHFYNTRHLLLFGLPLGLALLSAKRLADAVFPIRGVGVPLCVGVLAVLSAKLSDDYVFMQARWLKLNSLIASLPRLSADPPARVFNLVDGYLDYPARHVFYGTSELTGALRLAWGHHPVVGFTFRNEKPGFLKEMAALMAMPGTAWRDMDLAGPQATIIAAPGPGAADNKTLALRYYRCRLTGCDTAALNADLVRVHIDLGPITGLEPVAAVEPSHRE